MISIPRSQATLPRPNNSASNAQSLATLMGSPRGRQELPCGLSCPIFIFGWFWMVLGCFGMVLGWFLDGFGGCMWMLNVDECCFPWLADCNEHRKVLWQIEILLDHQLGMSEHGVYTSKWSVSFGNRMMTHRVGEPQEIQTNHKLGTGD